MNMREQLETVREAYDHAMRAQELYNAYRKAAGADGTATPELPFAPILVALTHTAEDIDRRIAERRARFDAAPVLQATLRFRDGSTRRVAVSKPTDEIDEPHIGEMFHAALVRQGVAASCEPWPVLVVDRRGRVVGEIPCAKIATCQRVASAV